MLSFCVLEYIPSWSIAMPYGFLSRFWKIPRQQNTPTWLKYRIILLLSQLFLFVCFLSIILTSHVLCQRTLCVSWDKDCLILCSYTATSIMNLLGAIGNSDKRGRMTNSNHYNTRRGGFSLHGHVVPDMSMSSLFLADFISGWALSSTRLILYVKSLFCSQVTSGMTSLENKRF